MDIIDNLIRTTKRKIQQAREAKPYDDSCSGAFPFAQCIVTFSLNKVHKDIEVWNPVKDTYLDCIANLLKQETPSFEDLETEAANVWDSHGFRDEADYARFKY